MVGVTILPALRRQRDLLLAAVERRGHLQPADLDRLRAVASDADPADRSRER